VPAYDDPSPRRAASATQERPSDVARARAAVRNAGVSYGPRQRRRSPADAWRDFTSRYGWRAYALPVLLVVTVAALMTSHQVVKKTSAALGTGGGHHRQGPVSPPVASGSITLKDDTAGGKINETVLKAAALPPGPAYTAAGNGTFRILKGTSPQVGTGRLYRYSIDVENGITGVDLNQYARLVVRTLSDARSWSGHGVALKRVDSGAIDFHISLVSSMTVRKLCGYTIRVETSCYAVAGDATPVNRVAFNVARWVRGSTAYVGDLAAYRIYMINHEDGHAMGHQHAHQCLPGGLAPVMMQQTFGLRSATTGKLCEANPWPYPPGAKGVPGPEQADTPKNDEYGLGD
jgi:Protein of unknown function (DUF3152)